MVPLSFQPVLQRPRERLRHLGVQQLSLEELIITIIGSGARGHQVHALALQLAEIMRRPIFRLDDLLAVPGIGLARATALMAAFHLPAKIQQDGSGHATLSSPEKLYNACSDLLEKAQEHLVVFFLSSRCTALQREIVSIGTATASLVHPREVFRAAIHHNASAIALAHNHPSGNFEPSEADKIVTQQVAAAGKIIGIDLVDHLVCTAFGFTSLKMASPHLFCYAKPV